MKFIILMLALGSLGVVVVGSNSGGPEALSAQATESKTQPKDVVLSKDSQSDKYGEVAFSHLNHATKNYNPEGTAVLTCVECHHTDQPPANLKAPLKTSERAVVLTTAALEAADAKGVKKCRDCHLQAGDDSAPMPTVQYADKPAPTKLTNEVAYHLNCNLCHDRAIAARPALKGKVPGSNDCVPCHKALK
jgi:Zn finger protein HypA/HybF involved in hydrogenase expression